MNATLFRQKGRSMDLVASMPWVGGIAAIILVAAAGMIAHANRGSENVVLGFAAMTGAVVLFTLQLSFLLRAAPVSAEGFATETLINLTARTSTALNAANRIRHDLERRAVEWAASTSPGSLDDPNRLALDLAVFSILNYITTEAADWRMNTTSYRFPSMGRNSVITFFDYPSTPAAYALLEGDLRNALKAGGNAFADAPFVIPKSGIRLPMGTTILVQVAPAPARRATLRLQNPISTLNFLITPAGVTFGAMRPPQPGAGVMIGQGALAGLPDALYSITNLTIVCQPSFAALRAHHPDVSAHQAWIERLERGLADWFKLQPAA